MTTSTNGTATDDTIDWTTWGIPTIGTIHPESDDFGVYGGPETVERAREWAINGGYSLVTGVPPCPHGIVMLPNCFTDEQSMLDHANIWVSHLWESPTQPPGARPFILAHNYNGVPEPLPAYAAAWGLTLTAGTDLDHLGDDWYGAGTTPVRLGVGPHNIWPLERELLKILRTS